MGLWTKKPLAMLQTEASVEGEHSLRRALGALLGGNSNKDESGT
jgi:hypothetical protein